MKVIEKVVIKPFAFPVDNIYNYDAQIITSLDGGQTFYHCGRGKFCKTLQEAEAYKKEIETA
ncbi:MAG: hypothetical protein NC131_01240 [Roseburia sp.]|nr:hypothetical protein [Roseburia sp.]